MNDPTHDSIPLDDDGANEQPPPSGLSVLRNAVIVAGSSVGLAIVLLLTVMRPPPPPDTPKDTPPVANPAPDVLEKPPSPEPVQTAELLRMPQEDLPVQTVELLRMPQEEALAETLNMPQVVIVDPPPRPDPEPFLKDNQLPKEPAKPEPLVKLSKNPDPSPAPLNPTRSAAIEVGAKAVRVVVLEREPRGGEKILLARTHYTSLAEVARDGSLRPEAIAETAEAVAAFHRRLTTEFGVPADNFHLFCRGGVPRGGNFDQLTTAAVRAAGGKPIRLLEAHQEVPLALVGLLPDHAKRSHALLFEVGSGDTRGGYFEAATDAHVEKFCPVRANVGVSTLAAVASRRNDAAKTFVGHARDLAKEEVADKLEGQKNRLPGLGNRDKVYLTGDFARAVVAFLHPDKAEANEVRLTKGDIKRFSDLVSKPPLRFPAVELKPTLGAAARQKAEKELSFARDVFAPTRLVAGAEILLSLAETFDLEAEHRELIFRRDGEYACLLAACRKDAARLLNQR